MLCVHCRGPPRLRARAAGMRVEGAVIWSIAAASGPPEGLARAQRRLIGRRPSLRVCLRRARGADQGPGWLNLKNAIKRG